MLTSQLDSDGASNVFSEIDVPQDIGCSLHLGAESRTSGVLPSHLSGVGDKAIIKTSQRTNKEGWSESMNETADADPFHCGNQDF